MRRILFTLSLILFFAGMAFPQVPRDHSLDIAMPKEKRLVSTMIRRLQISREVAWSKFCNHVKVSDPDREATVLASLKCEGRKIGLTDQEVERFFKPQIAASCRVQEELFTGWHRGIVRPVTSPQDLQKKIRPSLDGIGREMLCEWKKLPPEELSPSLQNAAVRQIRAQGFSPDVARVAASPLGAGKRRRGLLF